MNRLVVMLALAGAAAACNPYLQAESVAPPGRTARLAEVTNWIGHLQRYRLDLSRGVAIAVTCNDGGPCEHMQATSENPTIVEVRPASLALLDRSWTGVNQPYSTLVIVGKAPGTTRVHVVTKDGHRDVEVEVVPAGPTVSKLAAQ